MRSATGIALHLVAWAREECAAQEEALAVLEQQELAVRGRNLTAVNEAAEKMRELGPRGATRGRRRDQLLGQLAQVWNVPREALTLGSVVERLGKDAGELGELRIKLRHSTSQVLRATRRVGVLVTALRRISGDVIEVLLTDEDGSPLHEGGALVDAEV